MKSKPHNQNAFCLFQHHPHNPQELLEATEHSELDPFITAPQKSPKMSFLSLDFQIFKF
jgi:hypothetical protein